MPDRPPLARRLAAEGVGAFFLFATVIGSGIMAENLSRGNDAVALLGNAIATGAILFVLITMLGPISGAHMNPAVSLVAAGLGVTVVADCIRSIHLPRVVYRPLTVRGRKVLSKLYAIYRKDDPGVLLKAFLRLAKSIGQA